LETGRLPAAEVVADAAHGPLSVEDRYIVVLHENSAAAAGGSRSVASDIAADEPGVVPTHVYDYVFDGFAAVIPDDKLAEVRNDPRVAEVVPDSIVHADVQTLPTGIDRINADTNGVAKIDGIDERVNVDVAILDTAGDDAHPDLNIWAVANCTDSLVDSDDDGHGTAVGGIIGALDNNIGVVGVAPGARLWNIRVMAQGSGRTSWTICGMDLVTRYAVDQGNGLGDIEVANLSLSGSGTDSTCADTYHAAFCRAVAAGVTVVVSAGNQRSNAATRTPAAYDEVITVSALADSDGKRGGLGPRTPTWGDLDDSFAQFSNFGADVDIAAPGEDTLSTALNGGYEAFHGTSAAAPFVAGAAAIYKAYYPNATPAEVKSAMRASRDAR
jgi:subtilisin family serine protease